MLAAMEEVLPVYGRPVDFLTRNGIVFVMILVWNSLNSRHEGGRST